MTRENRFERWPRTALVATAAALLVACDLVAGAILPRPGVTEERLRARARDGDRRYDARYHHGFGPGVRYVERWGSGSYPVVSNQLGLRDSEDRDVPAYTPKRRIVLLGDSFVEGIGVAYEDTVAGVLDRRLGRERYDVLNAGASGASPKLYFHRLKFLLEEVGLKVDDVYVFVDTSDAHNEIEFESWEPGTPPYREPPRPGPFWDALRQRSYLADVAWQAVVRLRERERFAAERRLDDEMYEMFDPEVQERWGRRALEHLDEYAQRTIDLCKAHGVRATLVIFPHPFHLEISTRAPKWSAFWRGIAERNGVALLDLFPTFLDARPVAAVGSPVRRTPSAAKDAFFISGDIHWNPEGHRLVAEEILRTLAPGGSP